MNPNDELDPQLRARLESLRLTESRDPQIAAAKRAAFLAEAEKIAPTSVSNRPTQRHNGWKAVISTFQTALKKERKPMFNFALTLMLILGLVFGGGGATVAAAQSSLPDDALYGVKIWSEEIRLQLAGDADAQFKLMLQFTNRRLEELQAMLQAGDPVAAPILARIQQHIQRELKFAASQPEPVAGQMLEQIRTQLRTQEQVFAQLRLQAADEQAQAVRERVRIMIEQHTRLAENGRDNLPQLREQLRQQEQTCEDAECQPVPTPQQERNGTDESNGNNPWIDDTPAPGSKTPWIDTTPAPGPGYGPGSDSTSTPRTGNGSGSSGTPQTGGNGGKP